MPLKRSKAQAKSPDKPRQIAMIVREIWSSNFGLFSGDEYLVLISIKMNALRQNRFLLILPRAKKQIPITGLQRIFVCIVSTVLAKGALFMVDGNAAVAAATTVNISVPDTARQDDSLPEGMLAWDSLTKETNVVADASDARFVFNFTNVSSGNVVIQDVQPVCGCTIAQLPSLPWIIPTGSNGQLSLTVNLLGKARNQVKKVYIRTSKGCKELVLKINILPPTIPPQSEATHARALKTTQADRQAIFHGDCTTCHVKPGEGREGRALYNAVCANCHEGKDHAPTMPDLFAIQTPTNVVFWLDWIARGKPGSLMPAFSNKYGGPLSDVQIVSLARYLNTSDYLDPPWTINSASTPQLQNHN